MNKIIQKAILEYNLEGEEYYLDHTNSIRARGFFYDEDTGLYVDSTGHIKKRSALLYNDQLDVRQVLDLCPLSPFENIEQDIEVVQAVLA